MKKTLALALLTAVPYVNAQPENVVPATADTNQLYVDQVDQTDAIVSGAEIEEFSAGEVVLEDADIQHVTIDRLRLKNPHIAALTAHSVIIAKNGKKLLIKNVDAHGIETVVEVEDDQENPETLHNVTNAVADTTLQTEENINGLTGNNSENTPEVAEQNVAPQLA